MKSFVSLCALVSVMFTTQACSGHRKNILIGGLVGGAVGAGLGYGVVHHGKNRRYEVQNMIITSSLFALGVMGAMSLHYYLMDQQKVDIMSNLTSQWMENPANQNKVMRLGVSDEGAATSPENFVKEGQISKYSLELDNETRWVYPSFRRRYLQPEASADQMTSARYTWDIVRPGFFVSRETHPWYFQDKTKVRWNDEKSEPEIAPSDIKSNETNEEKAEKEMPKDTSKTPEVKKK